MSREYVITKTGRRLVEIIRQAVQQEYEISTEQVGMGIPGENNGFMVCVYLYDVQKKQEINNQQMKPVSAQRLQYPSSYYDLYYLIVPSSDSDLKFRAEEECRLIDILLQTLGDLHYIEEEAGIGFSLKELEFEEKMKIWNGLNTPFRTAVYGKAGPVEIESTRTKEIKRVTNILMDFVQ